MICSQPVCHRRQQFFSLAEVHQPSGTRSLCYTIRLRTVWESSGGKRCKTESLGSMRDVLAQGGPGAAENRRYAGGALNGRMLAQRARRDLSPAKLTGDGQEEKSDLRSSCRSESSEVEGLDRNTMVGEEGVEPSIPHGQRILSPPCMPFHHSPECRANRSSSFFSREKKEAKKSGRLALLRKCAFNSMTASGKNEWRRHPESNRKYKVLQTFALPFGHAASVTPILYKTHGLSQCICPRGNY